MGSFVEQSQDVVGMQGHKRKRLIIIVGAFFAILAAAAILLLVYNMWMNRVYSGYETITDTELTGGSSMKYLPYEDAVLQYSRDGISAFDANGNSIWNGSYDMTRPAVDICGSSVVVADVGGKELYVYNGDATGKEWNVDLPIVQACISEQGVVAVLLEDATSNVIQLYNPFAVSDTLLAEIPTNIEEGYPVCIDLSPDGVSVAAVYVGVSTGTVVSRVAFYNFSDVGKNTNWLVGAQNYEDQMVSEVRYLNQDTVCLFGEVQISIWNNMKKPVEKFQIDFGERNLKSAFCNASYIGTIEETDEKSIPYLMQIYDLSGKKLSEREFTEDYIGVMISGDEILLHSYSHCEIYRVNGVRKFAADIDGKVNSLFPAAGHNRYFFLTDSQLREIKLKN